MPFLESIANRFRDMHKDGVTFSDLWIVPPKVYIPNIPFWSCTWDVRLHTWFVDQSRVIKESENGFGDIGILLEMDLPPCRIL